jgi:hypothetical protein
MLNIIVGKNGKTLHLLKQTSKKINRGKRRKVIPILGSLKIWKTVNEIEQSEVQSQVAEDGENQHQSSLAQN